MIYTTAYIFIFFQVRVSVASQHLPMFTRLMDKDSHWSHANGLRSVIPHILIFGIIGYPFGLPDMIGGNAYNSIFIQHTAWPDRELYIRWLQLTALLPAMQFSVVPWHYDSEVRYIIEVYKAFLFFSLRKHFKFLDPSVSSNRY